MIAAGNGVVLCPAMPETALQRTGRVPLGGKRHIHGRGPGGWRVDA